MDRLIDVVEELVAAVERRESADADMAGWEAEADIRRLERLLVREYRQSQPGRERPPFPQTLVATH